MIRCGCLLFMKGHEDMHNEQLSWRFIMAIQNYAIVAICNIVGCITIHILIWLPSVIELGCSSIAKILTDHLSFHLICVQEIWVGSFPTSSVFSDLVFSDFYFPLPTLRLHLVAKHFYSDCEVKAAVNSWVQGHNTAWHNNGLEKLVLWYQKVFKKVETMWKGNRRVVLCKPKSWKEINCV